MSQGSYAEQRGVIGHATHAVIVVAAEGTALVVGTVGIVVFRVVVAVAVPVGNAIMSHLDARRAASNADMFGAEPAPDTNRDQGPFRWDA